MNTLHNPWSVRKSIAQLWPAPPGERGKGGFPCPVDARRASMTEVLDHS
ncbi:hypothetical protein M4D50_01655 [Rothia sp. p3-SID1597]|nr:hypothetical protein [Rothia sp. p3-SID1597]